MVAQPHRILLVDDEVSILKIIGKALEVAGFEVFTAGDGETAVSMAQTDTPDVVILDLLMPNRGGLEICAALRQDPRCRTIPVILYTGKGEDMSARTLAEWGANAYVSKTAGAPALVQKIHAVLSPHGA